MKRNLCLTILITLFALTAIFSTAGADYLFRIPKAQTTVEIESDGSMTIFVEYEIENLGQKLDFIDIGLPNNSYKLSDIQVQLNGEYNSAVKVTKADYDLTGLKYGISLDMGSASIPTGQSAVVDVWIPNLQKNIYEADPETVDDETVEYVGFQFSPNYFSSKFMEGSTDYSFIIVFPMGVGDGDAFYYIPQHWPGDETPKAWLDEDMCVVFEWYSENADMHTAYTFGGKFNKSLLTSLDNLTGSMTGSSGSSGGFDWEGAIATLIGGATCIGAPALFVLIIVRSLKKDKKARLKRAGKYFPPSVKTDGEGIKRGLTAVEAAILLETDLERVISMILYGLAKKNVIQVKSMDPLDVEIADPLPEGLNEYETDFIAALQEPNANKKKTKMREAMHRLILSVSKKMEGFSIEETRAYYKSICDKAWEQVEAADTPELKSQLLGDNFGWAMLEDDPEKRVQDAFPGEVFYPPVWWWRVDPYYRRRPSYSHSSPDISSSGDSGSEKRSGSSTTSRTAPTPMPILPGAMFARSITTGARKLANSLVGNTDSFKSAVKNRTNPDPIYSSSSSSHRHGGGSSGSSCACACACDSCACACAGGGR